MTKENNYPVQREYKSRLFAMIFSQKKELLELYNAVNGSSYTDPDLLEINTLKNAIYISMKNDLSFVIDLRLNLYEHQSTFNPNIPLRNLFYIADLLSEMTKNLNLYGRKAIKIPTPHFIVFYNGRENRPECEELKLSDLYSVEEEEVQLELVVKVLNINQGYNKDLMNSCKTLKDYCKYNERVRKNLEEMPLGEAVEKAVTDCIRDGILAEFLKENRAEAIKVSIYEFDQELYERLTKQEGYEEGYEAGIEAGIEAGCDKVFYLLKCLIDANRLEDVKNIATDAKLRERLLKEYHIS